MRFDAHGIGGAQDLPIPAEYAIAGACAALAVSFTVLALAWRRPRFNVGGPPRAAPRPVARLVDSAWFSPALRTVGFAFFGYVAAAAVFGEDSLINPFFGVFYVLLWVGIVPLSLVFGPFYAAVSPVRTINGLLARLSGSDPDVGLREYPTRLGYWPAALGLFAFVWFELVYPFNAELGPARLWCAVYVGLMLIGGAVFGNRFYAYADPFEVYSTLVGRLSVWGRHEGRLVVRSPLANLDLTPPRAGLLAVTGVLLGSTAFDSFRDSGFWIRRAQSLEVDATLLNTTTLLFFVVAVGGLFALGTMATGIHDEGHRRWELPALFAHSLVPIVVGYMVAHYLSYLVETGQQTVIQLSDPFSTGADYLGTGDRAVNYWLTLHPTFLATTKVLGVVLGHVVAVVAAHDRAVRLLPARHQLTGQLTLLVVMVGFTVGGLYLLFGFGA